MKKLFAVCVVAVTGLCAWTEKVEAQGATPIPIAPILEGVSNATATTTYSNSIVAPIPSGIGGYGSGAYPYTLVGSVVCPSNTFITGTANQETNPFYAYCELVYPTGGPPTNTTTDPIVLTLWAGTNTYTASFTTNPPAAGASGIFCDKIVSQSSNTPYFSLWLLHPN